MSHHCILCPSLLNDLTRASCIGVATPHWSALLRCSLWLVVIFFADGESLIAISRLRLPVYATPEIVDGIGVKENVLSRVEAALRAVGRGLVVGDRAVA